MKANFIIPSWNYWKEPLRAQPLTQLYLATILENMGHQIEFTDFRNGQKEIKEADLYLYTIASPDLKECNNIVNIIRNKFPNSKHIAGGPHPSILPEDMNNFDIVVRGRGEKALEQIMKDYPNNKKVYEVPVERNKKFVFPKRHFLSPEKIINNNLFKTDNIKSTTAQFSFGCPYSCSFCANYTRGPIYRRGLDSIAEEIDYLKSEYSIEGLSLQDENCLPLKNPEDFLNLLKEKQVKWRGQLRADIPEKYIRLSKQSGLVELSFGLESVDEKVLSLANKKIKLSDVERTIKICKECDIPTRVYLLNGLPGEDKSIVKQTIDFIERNNPDLILLSSLMPYPGSPIYNHPSRYGIKSLSREYNKFNHIICRFKNSKDNPENAVPYEFEEKKGLSRKQIINNLLSLQSYLRGRGKNK